MDFPPVSNSQNSNSSFFSTKYGILMLQFIKFGLIGGFNTLVDFGILNALMYITKIYKGNGLILLNIVSFSVAVINSYFLNKYWAFKDKSSVDREKQFVSFLAVSIVGVVINTLVLRVVSTNIDPMFGLNQQIWTNIGKLLATGVSLVWNFIGYKFFVFKK